MPGSAFFANGGGQNTMRLNFSNATPAQVEEGIERLARVIRRRWPSRSPVPAMAEAPALPDSGEMAGTT